LPLLPRRDAIDLEKDDRSERGIFRSHRDVGGHFRANCRNYPIVTESDTKRFSSDRNWS
jgi:hypothetical protein